VIVAVLRSPLHGLLSATLLVLGYTGRRTGRLYRLPLSYVERDGRLYLCTAARPGPEELGWEAVVAYGGAALKLAAHPATEPE